MLGFVNVGLVKVRCCGDKYLRKDIKEYAETSRRGIMQLSDSLRINHHHGSSHTTTTTTVVMTGDVSRGEIRGM